MPCPVPVREGIIWWGANDRETGLFKGLWPLPEGVSFNTVVIDDERIALIGTVRTRLLPELLEWLRVALPPGRTPDYLVINQIEPDHSGAVAGLLERFPGLRVVGNARTLDLLAVSQRLDGRAVRLEDGELLDLGRHRLRAIRTPLAHRPESMMAFEERERLLFSGTIFAGFGAVGRGNGDAAVDPERLERETRRFYANVLGRYSGMIREALARVEAADPALIVPSHGPLWEHRPAPVRQWYERWSRFASEEGAVLVYASQGANNKRLAECVADGLAEAGVHRVAAHDVSRTHPSFILGDLWQYGAVALGTPTFGTGLLPAMRHLVCLLRHNGLKQRVLGLFGSDGSEDSNGDAMAQLRTFGAAVDWPVIGPEVETRHAPEAPTLAKCRLLGRNLAQVLRERAEAQTPPRAEATGTRRRSPRSATACPPWAPGSAARPEAGRFVWACAPHVQPQRREVV